LHDIHTGISSRLLEATDADGAEHIQSSRFVPLLRLAATKSSQPIGSSHVPTEIKGLVRDSCKRLRISNRRRCAEVNIPA